MNLQSMNLQSLYEYFARQKDGNWIIKPNNAIQLYKFIKENSIRKILDLGTGIGCSASIVSLALKEKNENYHIDTIEQFDKCIELANKIIPPESKENITIHKSETAVWNTDKIPYQYFSIYDNLPELFDYDLIINDGPSPFMINGDYVDLPNGTTIKLLLEDKIKPKTFIAYDGRILSLQLLERYFSDNFYLIKPADTSNLTIIQRKDNPIIFKDEKLEFMKQAGYF